MGQTAQRHDLQNKNANYFHEQIELFRWRANTRFNSHVSQVFFSSKKQMMSRDKLKHLLQQKFNQKYIQINKISQLSELRQNSLSQDEELMNFQQYLCDLTKLQSNLTLSENLYVLNSLLTGYEQIFKRFGKVMINSQFCFLTFNGEVRAWINNNYQSNDLEDNSHIVKTEIVKTEISIIKKILSLTESFASNYTEYLHFLKQFRSFADRDMANGWIFPFIRKFINGYAYNYKIDIVRNLAKFSQKMTKSIRESQIYNENSLISINQMEESKGMVSFQSISKLNLKNSQETNLDKYHQLNSSESQLRMNRQNSKITLQDFISPKSLELKKKISCQEEIKKNKNIQSNLKGLLSNSEYMMKKSQLNKSCHVKTNTNSMPNSQFVSIQEKIGEQNKNGLFLDRIRSVSSMESSKQFNFKSDNNKKQQVNNYQSFQKVQSQLIHESSNNSLENINQIKKSNLSINNDKNRPRQKLEKKTATISKMIAFQDVTNRSFVALQQIKNQQKPCFILPKDSEYVQDRYNVSIRFGTPPNEQQFSNRNKMQPAFLLEKQSQKELNNDKNDGLFNTQSSEALKVNNEYMLPVQTNSVYMPSKAKEESNRRSQFQKKSKKLSEEDVVCNSRFFPIKTVSHLLTNSEVSMHESLGSFVSMEESTASKYDGALAQMGRSVFIAKKVENHYRVTSMISEHVKPKHS